VTDVTKLALWELERRTLPKGGCSAAERKAAAQEIKRRCGWAEGAVKIPPKTVAPLQPKWVPNVGWAYVDEGAE
jgi:hypothetical protein